MMQEKLPVLFEKFNEYNLSVIPIPQRSKAPSLSSWQRYCEELPQKSQTEAWDRIAGASLCNYGLCLGPASQIVAVDIDTDDPQVLATVPESPVKKKGQKGETRFFKYSSNIKSQKFHDQGVEILSVGNQTVIPPSIHPSGNAYHWLTPYDLFSQLDLPDLDLSFLNRLPTGPQMPVHTSGRNNKLVSMATAAFSAGKDLQTVSREIFEYDTEAHHPPLFSDRTEQKKPLEPWENAVRFSASVQATLIRNGTVRLTQPGTDILVTIPTPKIQEPASDWPRGRGVIDKIQAYCGLLSEGKQDALGLGGGLAFMGALASNRVFGGRRNGRYTTPNILILNIAPSGYGKDLVQKLVSRHLSPLGIVGSMTYKSAVSLVQDLPKQQEQLLILDEASMLLKMISNGEGYQQEMAEVICNIYSSAQDQFEGMSSKVNGARYGAALYPHMSMLASTTVHGFTSSVNQGMGMKGLMPRFIMFNQENLGEFNENIDESMADDLYNDITRFIKNLDERFPKRPVDFIDGSASDPKMGNVYKHKIIPWSKDSLDYLKDVSKKFFVEKTKDAESFDSAFKARFIENAQKIALLDWLSNENNWTKDPAGYAISLDSLFFGMQVIERSWKAAKPLYEQTSSENKYESYLISIKKFIENKGVVSRSDLTRRFQNVDPQIRKKILDDLMQGKYIAQGEQRTDSQRPLTIYSWLD